MEDFRNKIKNFKATPNDNSWERMVFKQEKQKFTKVKTFVFALLAINALGFSILTYQFWNKSATETTPTLIGEVESNIIANDHDQEELKELKELKADYDEKISALTSSNSSLQNQVKLLQEKIEKNRRTLIETKRALIESDRTTSNLEFQLAEARRSITSEFSLKSVDNKKDVSASELVKPLFPLSSKFDNSIEKYLLNLAGERKFDKPLILNQVTVENQTPRNWYLSLGTTHQSLTQGKQRNLSIGVFRSMHRLVDLGLLVNIGSTTERSEFLINNEVKDRNTEAQGLLMLRINALRFNKVLLFADGGLGYKFGSFTSRRGIFANNNLEYFNETTRFNGIAYQLGIGGMYYFTPRLSAGARFYLEGDLNSNINLNYRF